MNVSTTNHSRQNIEQLERNLRIVGNTHNRSFPARQRQRKVLPFPRTRFVNATRLNQHNAPNLRSTYALISLHGDPIANICKQQPDGLANYVRELGIALAKQGSQVDIFTRCEHPDLTEVVEIAPGCRMIRLAVGPAKALPRTELAAYLSAFATACLAFQIKSQRDYTPIESNYWLSSWLEDCVQLPQPFRFYLVSGSGTNGNDRLEKQRLQDLVKELGLQSATSFVATVPPADLPNYYVAANVCFIPSYYEPFGLVALETMTVGNPVSGGETELATPGRDLTRLAAEIDNPQSWAANRTPKWLLTNFSSTRLVTKKQHIYQSLTLAESVRSAIDSQQIVPILAIQLQQLPQFQQLDWHKQEEILNRLLILRRDRHICHQNAHLQ